MLINLLHLKNVFTMAQGFVQGGELGHGYRLFFSEKAFSDKQSINK